MDIQYLYECFIKLFCCMNVFVSPVPNKSIREAISSLCSLCLVLYIFTASFHTFQLEPTPQVDSPITLQLSNILRHNCNK